MSMTTIIDDYRRRKHHEADMNADGMKEFLGKMLQGGAFRCEASLALDVYGPNLRIMIDGDDVTGECFEVHRGHEGTGTVKLYKVESRDPIMLWHTRDGVPSYERHGVVKVELKNG